MGKGAYLAVPKAVNGQELAVLLTRLTSSPIRSLTLDGDSMSLTVETAAGVWWSFNLEARINIAVKG